jgi:hypothetical protein
MSPGAENGENALERIRRYKMNAFDGARIAADLEANADLWEEVWMNWDDNADVLSLSTSTWDNASRLLEIASYWRSDGFEATGLPNGKWRIGGWWD